MFHIERPSDDDLTFFYENGYVLFPDVLTDAGRRGLTSEILRTPQVVDFLRLTDEERGRSAKPHRLSLVPWNEKGPWAKLLFHAPLVSDLLCSVVGPRYHFCHSEVRISMRGSKGLIFHHDNRPIDLSERHKWYIQMLYYPDGFVRGDASLWVIPGSHAIADWGLYQPYGPPEEQINAASLSAWYAHQVGKTFEAVELELPPGSMAFLNARLFHAVSPKPLDSPQEMRLFTNYLFKEPGAPHRFTQVIPPEWSTDGRLREIFDRPACTEYPHVSERSYG
jgi:hypothetical protein